MCRDLSFGLISTQEDRQTSSSHSADLPPSPFFSISMPEGGQPPPSFHHNDFQAIFKCLEAPGTPGITGGMDYDSYPLKCMLFRFSDHFMLNYRDFHAIFMHLEAPGTPGTTGGMDYDSHPSIGILFRFSGHFMLHYHDFR